MSDKPKTLREIAELARTRQFHAERAGKPITSTDFGEIARHTETWREQAEALVRDWHEEWRVGKNEPEKRQHQLFGKLEAADALAKLLGLED